MPRFVRRHRRLSILGVVVGLLAGGCAAALPPTTSQPTTPPPTTLAPTTLTPRTSPPTPLPLPNNSLPSTTPPSTLAPPSSRARLLSLDIWTFPGPAHYEGDLLTFQVPLGGFGIYDLVTTQLAVDGVVTPAEAQIARDPLLGDSIVFPNALDSTGLVGRHLVEIEATLTPAREIDLEQSVVVMPDGGRPAQEVESRWQVIHTDCCDVEYLENTAASRDLAALVETIDTSAAEVEQHFGRELPRVRFVLIDRVWGNGGYAGDEVVVSYLDRDFSPGRLSTFRQTVLHELAHVATDELEFSTPWPLIEGVAVQFTQGHFKPEPLGQRARALSDAGDLPPIDVLFDTFRDLQHETRYAAVGAFTQYLVDEYGLARLIDLFDSELAPNSASDWLDAAASEALGAGLDELQVGFDAWVASFDAGDQLRDLELTVALQEARRSFQAANDPYPSYSIYPSVTETGQNALAMRDAGSPDLVAMEALIAYGQDLVIAGDLDEAAAAVADIEEAVAIGALGSGLSGEFLAVAEAVDAAGYELVSYRPQKSTVTVVATANPPELTLLDLQVTRGSWEVVAGRLAPPSISALD